MSKQLTRSAVLSVLAMLGFALAATPVAADELGLGTSQFQALASACSSVISGDLMPLLQPGLQ